MDVFLRSRFVARFKFGNFHRSSFGLKAGLRRRCAVDLGISQCQQGQGNLPRFTFGQNAFHYPFT
jgi:hypothetical protein